MTYTLIPEPLNLPHEERKTVRLLGLEIDLILDERLPDNVAILHNDNEAVVWDGNKGTITRRALSR